MCPFTTSKADEEEIKNDILEAELQDADMESEEETGDENLEERVQTRVWTEIQQRKANAALLMYIIESYQHVSIVETLKPIMASNQSYILPERKDITKKILPHMYNFCLNEQKEIIKEAITICLTIEKWDSIKGQSIISIAGHYVNSEFELKSILIKCCEFYDDDNEETVTFLRETCTEWDIFSKINGCVIANSDYSIKQAVKLLDWKEFGCTASALNIILKMSLKVSKPILEKVKKITQHFLTDSKSMDMLNDYQTNVQGFDDPLEIMDSNITNWSATYDMIAVFLALQNAITSVLTEIGNAAPEFTNEDWITLKQLLTLYKPILAATKDLGDDKYVCVSTVIAIVNNLKISLQEMNNSENFCYVKNEIKYLIEKFNTQFQGLELETDVAMCTLLDPRYKLSKFLDMNATETAKANLLLEVQNLMNVNSVNEPAKIESDGDDEECNEHVQRVVNDSELSLVRARDETDLYIQEDLTTIDPSVWWQTNQQKFPHIAQLYKTKCNIVATSLLGEYLFTEKGNNLSDNRHRLSANKAKYMVFLKANLKEDDDFLRAMP